ncbi:AAA family ATPase, partial [Coxiella burnetii]
IHTITQSDKELLIDLPKQLKRVVFGQSQAVESLCNAIKLSRAGLNNADKPVGSVLLSGPTGVGKTEVTRKLAKASGIELIRFDMSEYMERHAVSRLIGAPPGYVGFDQGGLLTEIIRKQPHAVLLLDEIEKAHPDIFNILLQVMDYGYLTDNTGRKADFRHVIIVMTTNAGAEQLERGAIGFAVQDMEQENLGANKHNFTHEYRNRLDAVIQFKYLDTTTILKIVDKFTRELRDQLKEKGIRLTISSDAKQWLAERGYNEKMGARPMARLIQEKLKVPIANQLLFSELNEGDEIIVNRANGDLVVQRKQIVV